MRDGSEIKVHITSPMNTAKSGPVIDTTDALSIGATGILPYDSVLNQGLSPEKTEKDLFAYLSPENQARFTKMLADNIGERNVFGDMFSKTSILESNPEIPGDPRGKIDRLAIALLDDSIGKALKLPPVNLVMGNSDKVNRQISDAGSSKINFNA